MTGSHSDSSGAAGEGPQAALNVKEAVLRFGGITAISCVSFEVQEGMTFGIIGPNGAGKTALLNCINGIYRLNSGTIDLFGQPIHDLATYRIAALGLSRTFQGTEHFQCQAPTRATAGRRPGRCACVRGHTRSL